MHSTEPSKPPLQCTRAFRHPLEIIPFFGRFQPSVPRDLIYTLIWNSLFALFFTALSVLIDPASSIADSLRITFVFAQCIGFVIYGAFFFTEKVFKTAIGRLSWPLRSAYYAIVAIIGIFPGANANDAPELRAALAALSRLAPGLMQNGGPERLAWIRASVGQQVRLIAVDDVCYFQANDKYTSVFTKDGEGLIRTPLRELAEGLDPARFWQVHRGTIVNLAHVQATNRDFAGRLSLALKTRAETIAVSRAFAHRFRQM